MTASTFMICLTAFEAMLAEDQPMVAIKFQMYMFSAFAQIFYWCFTGNMVYYNVSYLQQMSKHKANIKRLATSMYRLADI